MERSSGIGVDYWCEVHPLRRMLLPRTSDTLQGKTYDSCFKLLLMKTQISRQLTQDFSKRYHLLIRTLSISSLKHHRGIKLYRSVHLGSTLLKSIEKFKSIPALRKKARSRTQVFEGAQITLYEVFVLGTSVLCEIRKCKWVVTICFKPPPKVLGS